MKTWIILEQRNIGFPPNLVFCDNYANWTHKPSEIVEYLNTVHDLGHGDSFKAIEIEIPDSIWNEDNSDQRTEMGR